MMIDRIDHIVLTIKNIETTMAFYSTVLNMEPLTNADGRYALRFGHQKINLHQSGLEHKPHASSPLPGSGDLCLITNSPITTVMQHLQKHNVAIIEGPIDKDGAIGRLNSIYFHDPDGNLIEISNYYFDEPSLAK